MGNQAVRSAKLAGRPSGFSQGCNDQMGESPNLSLQSLAKEVDSVDLDLVSTISKSSRRDAITNTAVALELRPREDDRIAAK